MGSELVGEEENYLGDVVISYPQAARQAGDYANTAQEELELLTVHGILHLLGHDHEEEMERKRMWRWQEELLRGFRAQDRENEE
jgi:probable rRNA maturation factor